MRHGRSAHVHAGWIDLEGFLRWRNAYEAAGIDENDRAPDGLRDLATGAAALVSSDAPRAIASAALLAPGREVMVSPLLRELDLIPPRIPWLRMPLALWALTFAVKWLARRRHSTPDEDRRAHAAASWLIELSNARGVIVVVTHATFRSVLADVLAERGWQRDVPRRRSAHWSMWTFSP